MPKVVCFGSVNRDLIYRMPHIIRSGETVSALQRTSNWGGKGLNQAVALAGAGLEVTLWARTGGDAEEARTFLSQRGVDTSLVHRDAQHPTGHAIVQLDADGDNCIIIFAGANRAHRPEDIDAMLSTANAGDLLVVQNETNLVPAVIAQARTRGMRVVYNPSPMDADARAVDLDLVDVLFVNEHEATALAGADDPERALSVLCERFPRVEIVLTLGVAGSCWRRGDEQCRADAVRVPVVDTTAAGDTFTGFFLGARARGFGPGRSLEVAAHAASLAVGREGAAPSIPTWAELDRAST